MNRQQLTDIYLRPGQLGLEVAGLHNPWPLPPNAHAIQLDLFETHVLRAQYPEMANKKFVPVQILDDATYLKTIASNSMDFLCSSHVLEHVQDAIGAIEHWLRVVRQGGHLLIAVPEMNSCFDRDREPTTWAHFKGEYRNQCEQYVNLYDHYYEYFSKVDKLSGDQLINKAEQAVVDKNHIHFHCWNTKTLLEFFDNLPFGIKYLIREYKFVGHEIFVVLEKL